MSKSDRAKHVIPPAANAVGRGGSAASAGGDGGVTFVRALKQQGPPSMSVAPAPQHHTAGVVDGRGGHD